MDGLGVELDDGLGDKLGDGFGDGPGDMIKSWRQRRLVRNNLMDFISRDWLTRGKE
jgi:hypothetical protein